MALILHPHPLHGGTMNNRITYSMYQAFQRLGCSVMRFNFRGVGRSQGRYDGGIGEISDAAAALDWMQAVNPNSGGLWIAGYSFGAFIGMQLLMRRPEISGWVSVAPPANHYDFGFLAPCPCGGLMIHGDADELVPEPAVRKLVDKLNTQKGVHVDYRVVPGCGPCVRQPCRCDRRGGRRPLRQGDRPPPDGAGRRLSLPRSLNWQGRRTFGSAALALWYRHRHGRRRPATHGFSVQRRGWPACAGHDNVAACLHPPVSPPPTAPPRPWRSGSP